MIRPVRTLQRYGRIYLALARNCLVREMSFRGHFLVNAITEALWLLLLLVFFKVIYLRTKSIAGWSENELLFLIGTHYLIVQFFEMLFFTNCMDLSDQIRTGNLDFVLLKPVNAQFLVSVRKVNFSSVANIPVALALIFYSGLKLGLHPGWLDVLAYAALVICGVLILYTIIFLLAISAFWFIRNQSLFELWYPVTSFAQYPIEIYSTAFRLVLIFVVPVLAVANFPARVLVKSLDLTHALYACGWVVLAFFVDHWFFQFALKRYRSASS